MTPPGDQQSSDRGVIYTAIRARYVEEAAISARSLRAHLPDIKIWLYTDCPPEHAAPFDEIVTLTQLSAVPHLDKLVCMKRSPFRETLFLDTDTYVCGPVAELFELLARFDMAMALERRYFDSFPADDGVPAAFSEYNHGVIAYRQSPELQAVLQAALDWAEEYRTRTGEPSDDQTALRIALYESKLRIATLTQEYNCRFHSFGWLNGPVKILHARIPGERHDAANLEKIARKLNRRTIPRVHIAGGIYSLERFFLRGVEHFFARRTATLFRPSRAVIKRLQAAALRRLGLRR